MKLKGKRLVVKPTNEQVQRCFFVLILCNCGSKPLGNYENGNYWRVNRNNNFSLSVDRISVRQCANYVVTFPLTMAAMVELLETNQNLYACQWEKNDQFLHYLRYR